MKLKFVNENGKEIQEYDITLKVEVLLELIAGIQADIGKYMDEKGIDEEKDLLNPLTVMYWDLVKMRDQLFKMKTMEEIMAVQYKSMYIRDLIKEIGA